ncbi:polysaccharide deacetylase family protein [Naasia lichenicola]|uniref:Polysaccharide deacetylase n=1 Tax=Naasia lichenicola TaxID=2565933 RepID=A0A4S4FUL6_9MICO|nr:polysaccharide deacetylase family protein [Naasia lichenicola]THG33306.1 polysaccharide deacetylase [Naasia lichenicola]
MENDLYSYSPITEREPIVWPEGKKIAFYLGLNIEHFHVGVPATSSSPLTAGFSPDPMNHGWRDYGTRAGIWRMIDLLDEVGLRASAITNSEVLTAYPQIVEAAVERDWAWIAHGQTNSILHTGMGEEEEAAFLETMMATWDAHLPARPQGWLGPALTETFATPRLLQERGVKYLLDWTADDRPFALNVPGMISVPYSMDVNDIGLFVGKATTGSQYEEMVMDQFEVLLSEGGNVMALPVHPFVVGQPFRFKYLSRVLKAITSHPDVWVTTSTDIADHFLAGEAAKSEPAAAAA